MIKYVLYTVSVNAFGTCSPLTSSSIQPRTYPLFFLSLFTYLHFSVAENRRGKSKREVESEKVARMEPPKLRTGSDKRVFKDISGPIPRMRCDDDDSHSIAHIPPYSLCTTFSEMHFFRQAFLEIATIAGTRREVFSENKCHFNLPRMQQQWACGLL